MTINAPNQVNRNNNRFPLGTVVVLIVLAVLAYAAYAAYQKSSHINGVYSSEYNTDHAPGAGANSSNSMNNASEPGPTNTINNTTVPNPTTTAAPTTPSETNSTND